MVSAPMITRKNVLPFLFDARAVLTAVVVASVAAAACNKAALLAPTNSTITLTSGTRVLPNGTTVRFTTSLGRVDPIEAETSNGVAVATFVAGNESGTAEIRAISGLASGGTGTGTTTPGTGTGGGTTTTTAANVVQITIGAAAANRVSLQANPSSVRPSGSSVQVSAFVSDANGDPLPNVPVTFSTNRGTITPAVDNTDGNGLAEATLTASETATVTARVGSGAENRTATLEVRTSTTPSFTLATSPATPTAGQPVVLTITPAANTAPRVVVDWGDGTPSQDLGTVAAARSVTHTYALPGFYTINASGSQDGDTFSNSTAVTIAQQPPVQVTVNPTTASVGVPFTFTITPTTGALIQNITIDYGDGQRDQLGAISTQVTRQHPYASAGAKVVTVTQRETNGNETVATVTVTVTN